MVSYDTDWAPWANFGPLRRFGEGTRASLGEGANKDKRKEGTESESIFGPFWLNPN